MEFTRFTLIELMCWLFCSVQSRTFPSRKASPGKKTGCDFPSGRVTFDIAHAASWPMSRFGRPISRWRQGEVEVLLTSIFPGAVPRTSRSEEQDRHTWNCHSRSAASAPNGKPPARVPTPASHAYSAYRLGGRRRTHHSEGC